MAVREYAASVTFGTPSAASRVLPSSAAMLLSGGYSLGCLAVIRRSAERTNCVASAGVPSSSKAYWR